MRSFALLGIMLLAAGPALAQTETPPSNAPAPNGPAPKAAVTKAAKPATTEDRINQRITQMHQRLKITPEQQPAWDEFAQTMRDNAMWTEQAYKDRRASVPNMSAPDNMRNFAQIEQARADGVKKLTTSFQTLYDGMSDDQKKRADALFRGYAEHEAAHRKAAK